METAPKSNNNEKREFSTTEEAITKFFIEKELKSLNYNTPEEAKAYVDEINAEYGDISFVAEDGAGFAVKFRADHLGEGFEEYKGYKSDENLDIEKAA